MGELEGWTVLMFYAEVFRIPEYCFEYVYFAGHYQAEGNEFFYSNRFTSEG